MFSHPTPLSLFTSDTLRLRLDSPELHWCTAVFFHKTLSSVEKARDVSVSFGTPWPRVSAGLSMLESVLLAAEKEEDLLCSRIF